MSSYSAYYIARKQENRIWTNHEKSMIEGVEVQYTSYKDQRVDNTQDDLIKFLHYFHAEIYPIKLPS